jgi:Rps23 Pro-64 3,4-dihydroxylase Tpa1-like proline 4-hydroxylase
MKIGTDLIILLKKKFVLRDKFNLEPNCKKLFDYLNSNFFLKYLSEIVGIELIIDEDRNWHGIHKYNDGDFLDIHSDAGVHPVNNLKKHVTLGIYLSKNWKEENREHLEIWEGDDINKKDCKLTNCVSKILPKFNTLVMFNNTNNAWHGNPEPVIIKNNEKRIFLTISYLSKNFSDNYSNKFKKAYFIPRPFDKWDDEKEKLKMLRCDPEKCKLVYNLN